MVAIAWTPTERHDDIRARLAHGVEDVMGHAPPRVRMPAAR